MGGAFDPSQYEARDNSPLPAGDYPLTIERAEVRKTKNGEGLGANVTFEVAGPTQTGRKVFVWFNLRHSNEVAEKIGQSEFAALCKAVGLVAVQDTDELLGKTFLGKVGIDKKDPTANRILAYKPLGGQAAPAPRQAAQPVAPQPQQTQPAASAAQTGKMPWER